MSVVNDLLQLIGEHMNDETIAIDNAQTQPHYDDGRVRIVCGCGRDHDIQDMLRYVTAPQRHPPTKATNAANTAKPAKVASAASDTVDIRGGGPAGRHINNLCYVMHEMAKSKGFWDDPSTPETIPSKIALMHSELSEALENVREGFPPDDKCPEFNGTLVELADCVIRIMDLCGKMKWPLGSAIAAKYDYNKGRPYKHGKVL